ncbi:ATP-dependent DNA helicase RecG [Elusimicrobiota bacterium]
MDLTTPIRYFKGIGPKKAAILEKHLNLCAVEDLILETPRVWEDRRIQAVSMQQASMQEGHKYAFSCKVGSVSANTSRDGRLTFLKVQAKTGDGGNLDLLWIRKTSFAYDVFKSLRQLLDTKPLLFIYGKATKTFFGRDIMVEDYEVFDENKAASPHFNRIVPVYPLTEGISQKELRNLRWKAMEVWLDMAPKSIFEDAGNLDRGFEMPEHLFAWNSAYQKIHFPENESELELARKSHAFYELLIFSTALNSRKKQLELINKPQKYIGCAQNENLRSFFDSLPFTLTKSQSTAIQEIQSDLQQPHPMNRLLQGEVGSGKTVVAIAAIIRAVSSGHQVAFIAPTEVLVFQHFATLKAYLEPLNISLAALNSDIKPSIKDDILNRISSGQLQVIVGTHAILQENVLFKSLALVIIDEQHRFGVKQRWCLRDKANMVPDSLVLSATPIPRTLALALYGDLDMTTMEELPPGRTISPAKLISNEDDLWDILRQKLDDGGQAYITVPAIEDDNIAHNIIKETKRVEAIFPENKIGYLHGRMSAADKETVLSRFRSRDLDILITTTIIEVGVDVPGANIIIILAAERFGLATLHQLRGRVGRGDLPGICLLFPSQEFIKSSAAPSQAWERLLRFIEAKDGFDIGKLDLELRGPGELLGISQHGEFEFKYTNFQKDTELIAHAQSVSAKVTDQSANLNSFPLLKSLIRERFGKDFEISDIS